MGRPVGHVTRATWLDARESVHERDAMIRVTDDASAA